MQTAGGVMRIRDRELKMVGSPLTGTWIETPFGKHLRVWAGSLPVRGVD